MARKALYSKSKSLSIRADEYMKLGQKFFGIVAGLFTLIFVVTLIDISISLFDSKVYSGEIDKRYYGKSSSVGFYIEDGFRIEHHSNTFIFSGRQLKIGEKINARKGLLNYYLIPLIPEYLTLSVIGLLFGVFSVIGYKNKSKRK